MPFQVPDHIKQDPEKRWNLSDKVFFSCGACHILAHVFLERFPDKDFKAVWIRPKKGFRGNHVYVTNECIVFDWHGYSREEQFKTHYFKRYSEAYPGWHADLVSLNVDLTSRDECLSIGMNTRGADQYLHDPLPRAREYLKRFEKQHRSYGIQKDFDSD